MKMECVWCDIGCSTRGQETLPTCFAWNEVVAYEEQEFLKKEFVQPSVWLAGSIIEWPCSSMICLLLEDKTEKEVHLREVLETFRREERYAKFSKAWVLGVRDPFYKPCHELEVYYCQSDLSFQRICSGNAKGSYWSIKFSRISRLRLEI